jgi:glutamyl-tRNA synthetase
MYFLLFSSVLFRYKRRYNYNIMENMTVVTRFAPSPTGFLHIGGARTALFNWLYARHNNGKFLLRIEDTDRARSTPEAVDAILAGMKWLGLDWDDEEVYQFSRIERHKEVAYKMLESGHAYRCYCSKEELDAMREKAMAEKSPMRYDGTWRDRDISEAPKGVDPVIRLKAPITGETVIEDKVQGKVVVQNKEQDDMVLLRSDGTPTYMLAVVVDDHDMGVTHVIRGDDHLTNTFRQKLIYDAMGWDVPTFSHIPLIHGADGAKLSKRHGALGVEAYRDMGYLPEAIRNYLLRLGWSHGDDEIISTKQAIEWFNLESLGRSPSKFDFNKLDSVNGQYIREADDERLVDLIIPLMEEKLKKPLSPIAVEQITKGMAGLKQRVKNLVELSDSALFYAAGVPSEFTPKAEKFLDEQGKLIINNVLQEFDKIGNWEHGNLEAVLREYSEKNAIGLGNIMAPIRAAITGSHVSPSMFEVMEILGKEETSKRLKAV